MTKRIISAMLAAILIILTLSSCGSENDPAGSEMISGEAKTTETVTDEESSATTTALTTALSTTKSTTAAGSTSSVSKTQGSTAYKPASTAAPRPTASKKPASKYTKYEVSPSSVTTRIGTVVRAWKASQNGVSVEIHRVKYGGKITQDFKKANGDGAIDYNKKVTYQPYISVAVITANPSKLKTASSQTYLGVSRSGTNVLANKVGAFIAIDGEAAPYNSKPYHSTIRNGKVEYETNQKCEKNILLIYSDGRWENGFVDSSNSRSLINSGVVNTVRYQTQLNKNGAYYDNNWDQSPGYNYYHNRSVIGRISKNKYIFAVGEFMPLKNIATVLKAYGVQESYLINGGNCSELYLKGIPNATGIAGKQLNDLHKINYLESEFFYQNGMLGLASNGYQKTGGPCYDDPDIIYFR